MVMLSGTEEKLSGTEETVHGIWNIGKLEMFPGT
jgi:hypothetical protein